MLKNNNSGHDDAAVGEAQSEVELFQLACLHSDVNARRILIEKFRKVMLFWLYQHPSQEQARQLHTPDYYINQAFLCLWQMPHEHASVLVTREALLHHMQICLNRLILDTVRNGSALQKSQVTHKLPATAHREEQRKLWDTITRLLPEEREQRVAYLLYHCGLSPQEIHSYYPQEFPDKAEILHIRYTLIKHLQDRMEGIN